MALIDENTLIRQSIKNRLKNKLPVIAISFLPLIGSILVLNDENENNGLCKKSYLIGLMVATAVNTSAIVIDTYLYVKNKYSNDPINSPKQVFETTSLFINNNTPI